MLLAWLAACLVVGQTPGAVPVEQTGYGRAGFRLEGRTNQPEMNAAKRQAAESALARAGVQARWLEAVDVHGSALLSGPYMPCTAADPAANEAALKQWVREVHQNGMVAMSWYPLILCEAGWQAHPDWRQVFIQPDPVPGEERIFCCINTGYGDAVIHYCVDAVKRLGLDGIWFDGTAWTNIWQRPYALTCRCDACRKRFRADTGHDIPALLDWHDPVFREWVAWRFRVFTQYIGRLARAIRTANPRAAVVVNHYHRPGIPWRSAIPVDRYTADIISGSEATGPDGVDLTMRLCRAYGRSQSEVWRPFDLMDTPEHTAEPLLQHALAAYCAGGHPSFGGDPFSPLLAPTVALMTPVLDAIRPYVGGQAVPGVAVHVSQQTETFYFGRGDPQTPASDAYWASLGAWTSALGAAHLPPDYLYDADFTPGTLARYGAVLMPLSLCLTDGQARVALEYARGGGVLLLGIGAGQLDAQGEPRPQNALGQALGFRFGGVPAPDGSDATVTALTPAGGRRASLSQYGMRVPLALTTPTWRTVYSAAGGPAVAERPYGKGRVLIVSVDPGRSLGSQRIDGGGTRLTVTSETAASGRYSLKYVDDPVAPFSHYPDLETHVALFGTPRYTGGEVACDLRVDAQAHVGIELRSSTGPLAGPIVHVTPGGKVQADGKPVCDVPLDRWFHVSITWRFAREDRPADYHVVVTLPDGTRREADSPTQNPAFRSLDWLVVYGAGTQHAVFYLDNLTVHRATAAGKVQTVLSEDYEEGPYGGGGATLLDRLTGWLGQYARVPVRVDAPAAVRAGVYRAPDGRVLVHLHNRSGALADWRRPSGPTVTLRTAFPVRSARLPMSGRLLPVRRAHDGSTVTVGPVGLYGVVELRPAERQRR